ncbi:MAG: peptidase dimerization domain-containing protein, partial [Lentisphaeria bacterium]
MGTNVTHRKIIQELASFLYRNPETANNEFKACKKQVEILESMGFQVTVPYSSIPTSFRAEYKSPFAKNDCKTICFLSEYDALENMGHACGHHLIASAAFAGFLASVNLCETEKLNAKILLLGTPAEEGYGGKVQLLNAGAFENIDCCLITHPYYNTYLDSGTMAASRYKIKFLGKSSHAGNAPQDGVNALDSMITFFSSIGLYRQQMQKGNMVHG